VKRRGGGRGGNVPYILHVRSTRTRFSCPPRRRKRGKRGREKKEEGLTLSRSYNHLTQSSKKERGGKGEEKGGKRKRGEKKGLPFFNQFAHTRQPEGGGGRGEKEGEKGKKGVPLTTLGPGESGITCHRDPSLQKRKEGAIVLFRAPPVWYPAVLQGEEEERKRKGKSPVPLVRFKSSRLRISPVTEGRKKKGKKKGKRGRRDFSFLVEYRWNTIIASRKKEGKREGEREKREEKKEGILFFPHK